MSSFIIKALNQSCSYYYYYYYLSQILCQPMIGWLMSCDCILNISFAQTVEKLKKEESVWSHCLHHKLNKTHGRCEWSDVCPWLTSHMDIFTIMYWLRSMVSTQTFTDTVLLHFARCKITNYLTVFCRFLHFYLSNEQE